MQIFACNWRVGLPWKGFSQQPACRPKLKTYKKRYYFFLLKIRKKEKSSTSQGHFRPHHIINSCNCQHNYYIELMYFATKLSVTMLRFKGSHHVSLSHNSAPSVYQDACILRWMATYVWHGVSISHLYFALCPLWLYFTVTFSHCPALYLFTHLVNFSINWEYLWQYSCVLDLNTVNHL